MTLNVTPRWKGEIVVTDEAGQSFIFGAGWGVTPAVAYVPAGPDWTRCTPRWLWQRRDELIGGIRATGHVVEEGPYPPYSP